MLVCVVSGEKRWFLISEYEICNLNPRFMGEKKAVCFILYHEMEKWNTC